MDRQKKSAPGWRVLGDVCALCDTERHIGHLVRIEGRWHAFDATHSNESGNGFLPLGTFAGLRAAQRAVEQSYLIYGVTLAGAA